MKRTLFIIGLVAIFALVSSCNKDQPINIVPDAVDQPASLSEAIALGITSLPKTAPNMTTLTENKTQSGAITWYTNKRSYLESPGTRVLSKTEGFENGSVLPGGAIACPDPANSSSNNACWTPGALVTGMDYFSDQSPSIDGLALVGAGFLGNPTDNLVANFFVQAFHIDIFPVDCGAVGINSGSMDLIDYLGGGTVTVTLFDCSGGFLASGVFLADPDGEFLGFNSTVSVGSISIDSVADGAEGVDNLVVNKF
ncbi:MAG: hypothetical protein ACE5I1_29410 [bacterium]